MSETTQKARDDATAMSKEQRSPLGLGVLAILACCGLKVIVLAALALPVGSVGVVVRNIPIALAGLAVAVALVVYIIRRPRRCDAAWASGDEASPARAPDRAPAPTEVPAA